MTRPQEGLAAQNGSMALMADRNCRVAMDVLLSNQIWNLISRGLYGPCGGFRYLYYSIYCNGRDGVLQFNNAEMMSRIRDLQHAQQITKGIKDYHFWSLCPKLGRSGISVRRSDNADSSRQECSGDWTTGKCHCNCARRPSPVHSTKKEKKI